MGGIHVIMIACSMEDLLDVHKYNKSRIVNEPNRL